MYKNYLVIASKLDKAGINITTQLSQFGNFNFYLVDDEVIYTENLDLVRLWFEFKTRVENLERFYAARGDLGNPSFPEVEIEPTEGLASVTELVNSNFQMDAQGGILFFDQMVIGKYIEEMLVGTSTPVQVLEKIDTDRAALMEIAE